MLKDAPSKVLARIGVLTLRRPTIEVARGKGWGTRDFYIMRDRRIAATKKHPILKFLRYFFFGLGEDMPKHRDGKTTGELESEAMGKLMNIIWLNQAIPR